MSSKYCKECIKEIEAAATKCPFCQSSQKPLTRALDSPLGRVIVFLSVFAVFFTASDIWMSNKDIFQPKGFVILKENFGVVETDCGLKIVYFGEITNLNDSPYQDFHFNLEAFDENGKLVEAFSENQYSLLVPPNGRVKFKLAGKVNSKFTLPSDVRVIIVKAEEI